MKHILIAILIFLSASATVPANAQNQVVRRTVKTSTMTTKKTAQLRGKAAKKSNKFIRAARHSTANNKSCIISASYSNDVLTVNGVSYEFVRVESGTFMMGAASEVKDSNADEKPVHQVTLTNNYYIGKTEVTQALWKAVMGINPSNHKGDNLPVECVSWSDCQKFISKLNAVTGKNFRLPTEAEWEFAARGGNNSKHYQYSGSNNINEVAWYYVNSGDQTHDVATKQPNELGIYDMSGNVYEWCQDWYGNYSSFAQTNPLGSMSGDGRVSRGGSWCNFVGLCRSSFRRSEGLSHRIPIIGLRLCFSE